MRRVGALLLSILIGSVASVAQAAEFKVASPSFIDGKTLPEVHVLEGFGCSGGNRSPALTWSGAPPGTRSFAVTLYDPDAPSGSGWWHWTVFNIPASVASLPEGAGSPTGPGLPEGAVQGRTDFGSTGFGGACPPKGDAPHRYVLTVWALKVDKLPLDASATGAMVGFYLNANAIAKTSITALYGR